MDNIFWLVTVSEFVRFRIGKYADEAIAELWQLFAEFAPGRKALADNKLSGETIVKKRERLQKSHSGMYVMCIQRAADLAEIPLEVWEFEHPYLKRRLRAGNRSQKRV
jgi:hypothetical protein